MKLFALRAAERMLWDVYSKQAKTNEKGSQQLGFDWEWTFRVWWFNTLSSEDQAVVTHMNLTLPSPRR